LPPILIQVGSAEVLLDDSIRFAAAGRAAGVDVELQVWDDMIHVWHCFAALIPEGGEAITKIAEYLEQKFS
jgi:acetyl esterase/lipase